MRFKLLISVLMTAITAVACTNKSTYNTEEMKESPKAIVCYFSATGTTKAQAQRLSEMIGAEIHEILPKTAYSSADLDWHDAKSRSSVEMNDSLSRPAIGNDIDLSKYDIVFIGYPNWWDLAPRIINTFIDSHDLTGKTIVPFMTSGGSGISNSERNLSRTYPDLDFAKGLLMNGVSDEEINAWVSTFSL